MKRLLWLLLVTSLTLAMALPGCTATPTQTQSQVIKIRVATDATWAPFESVNDQTKKIEGFDIDLMNAIAQRSNLQIEYVNVAWDPLLAGMAQGTYDAAISSMTITPERAAQFLFSDPYFNAGQIITVRIDNTTITGKGTLTGKVGAQIGTTGAIELAKISGVTLVTYDDISLAFGALKSKSIDAVVCDAPVALGYVGKNATAVKTVGTAFTDENYGIAVAKGKTEILARINSGLAKAKADGIIEQLTTKWLKS